jgi:hypothetical protein
MFKDVQLSSKMFEDIQSSDLLSSKKFEHSIELKDVQVFIQTSSNGFVGVHICLCVFINVHRGTLVIRRGF